MSRRICFLAAVILVGGISVSGCSRGAEEAGVGGDPASVAAIDGPGGLHRVQLSADAAARIGLKTDTVRRLSADRQVGGAGLLVVDMAAVLYDQDGATWVYGQTEPLTFQRMPVVVSRVDGTLAVLLSGPPVGTAVATLGAAELRGSEDGVPGE
ncbi:MAG: hypothetical protein QOF87_1001 [Pseudonocardiales bacterium]|jgi:hypothetical protein|nr:hypothetical protein [Pseudonocardiales bacterium]MDT4907483.1 hypothetical protein [Pseudonocardiales bacterium]MDT4961354.1 hypothetical protein [Pseudonocardiales bacterium]MDT4973063.1 hypothetical protein [Pseudonocardiales bacterium]MDT4976418.1 hypothetical protein [Pseudonocardiales bacterium]